MVFNSENCTLIGLAEDLPIGESLDNCEIIALPSSMQLNESLVSQTTHQLQFCIWMTSR